jgi:DNA-binding FrmR family transcriptional regulator
MKETTRKTSRARLARIEGQVRAIGTMIDDNRYCIDVVRQLRAASAALASLERDIIDYHIDTCVQHALMSDDLQARREKVEELAGILGGRKK